MKKGDVATFIPIANWNLAGARILERRLREADKRGSGVRLCVGTLRSRCNSGLAGESILEKIRAAKSIDAKQDTQRVQ